MSKINNLQKQIRDLTSRLTDPDLTEDEITDLEDQIDDLEFEIEELYEEEHTSNHSWK